MYITPFRSSFCCINAPFGKSSFQFWSPNFIIRDFAWTEYFTSPRYLALVKEKFARTLCRHISEMAPRKLQRKYAAKLDFARLRRRCRPVGRRACRCDLINTAGRRVGRANRVLVGRRSRIWPGLRWPTNPPRPCPTLRPTATIISPRG